jgi:rfaE bifunctional protein nucleotidyltransferase chain/domain
VRVVGLGYDGTTPEKIRMCAGEQVMLRLDRGRGRVVGHGAAQEALDVLAAAQAVVVSDYGRGVTAIPALRDALAAAAHRIPLVWDPHPRGSDPVSGCRLVTPNEREMGAHLDTSAQPAPSRFAALTTATRKVARLWSAQAIAVTLGPDGALLSQHDSTPLLIPAPRRSRADPCGAGDRFATAAAIALTEGALTTEAVQVGVAQASQFVAAGGARGHRPPAGSPAMVGGGRPAAQAVAEVRARDGVVVATGGCFDLLHAGHIATLTAARDLGDCLIVCVNSDESVARLKGRDRPLTPAGDRVRMLTALSCVDAVAVFDENTPVRILEELRPDIWVKGGDYLLDDTGAGPALPEAAVVGGWGGQCVLVPYLSGYSTTGIIQAARTTAPSTSKEYVNHD